VAKCGHVFLHLSPHTHTPKTNPSVNSAPPERRTNLMGIRWEVDWNTLRTQKFKTSPTPLPPNKKNFGPLGCMFLHHFMHPRGRLPSELCFFEKQRICDKILFFQKIFPKMAKVRNKQRFTGPSNSHVINLTL